MSKIKELRKYLSPQEANLVEYVSLVWARKCDYDLTEEIYEDLINLMKFTKEVEERILNRSE